MPTKPFTVRTEAENLRKLDLVAKATARSRNYLVNAAIDRFLAEEMEFVTDVQAGQIDFEEGRTLSHEDVFLKLRSKTNDKFEAPQ